MEAGVERLLLGGVLEPLLAEPLAPHDGLGVGRQETPVTQTEPREPLPIAQRAQACILAARRRPAPTGSVVDSSKVGELLLRASRGRAQAGRLKTTHLPNMKRRIDAASGTGSQPEWDE